MGGWLSAFMTMPRNGAPNTAESVADKARSATAFAFSPARLSVRPIQVQAAAMIPERPASGPTEPPNASGSRKLTKLAAPPRKR